MVAGKNPADRSARVVSLINNVITVHLTYWSVCIGAVLLLGAFRIATDAELAFASLTLFPVLFIAWIGGEEMAYLWPSLGP